MAVKKADLHIYQGDDYSAVIAVSSNTLPPSQVIAGYTAKAQIRSGPADTATSIIASFVTSVSSPYINISLPNSVTQTIPGAHFVWDLQIVSPSGIVTTILRGDVDCTLEITR